MGFDFIEGDIVRLTGEGWDGLFEAPKKGAEVRIVRIDEEGDPAFVYGDDDERDEWYIEEDFEAELVSRGEVDASLLKKGDKVRLVGRHYGSRNAGKIVEITKDQDHPDVAWFRLTDVEDEFDWNLSDGWEIEKVDTTAEVTADTSSDEGVEPEPEWTQRFKVGDWVEITGHPFTSRNGQVFQVTGVNDAHGWSGHKEPYYTGDKGGAGIWDRYLKPAEPEGVLHDEKLVFSKTEPLSTILGVDLASPQTYKVVFKAVSDEGNTYIDTFNAETLKTVDAISPDHYQFGGAEVIDITRHLGFLEGNVIKYVARAGRKGDRHEDLLKARQYLDWAIEDAA